MDPQTNQNTKPPQPAQVPPPGPAFVAPAPKDESSSTSRPLLFLVVVLFILFISMLGFLGYSYIKNSTQRSSGLAPTPVVGLPVAPSVSITPTAAPLKTASDVSAIEIGSPEGDLQDIKSDLQGL